jgi:rhodanese-related sulfurtransferase
MRLLSVLAVAMMAASCTPSSPPAAASPAPSATVSADHVDGAKAHALVHDGAVLVDVRSPEEFASKHIEGAVNVPVDEVTSHDFGGKDKPVVLYCARGHRSEKAGEALRGQGYTHVYVLGAMSAWDQ